jgi:hypothetical protein
LLGYVATIALMIFFVSAISGHPTPEWAAQVFVRMFADFKDSMNWYSRSSISFTITFFVETTSCALKLQSSKFAIFLHEW